MFSSKFLSGANPLNAVSSAVNKFGLFGDDGEGDKKSSPQQGRKPSGEQQTGAVHGKDTHQEQGPTKSGQGPSMQKSQPHPKQGSPQLQGNKQTGPANMPSGQQATSSRVVENPKTQPMGPPQQVSLKHGAQQVSKSGAQPESPKVPPDRQQAPPKTKVQQGPAKTGAQQQEPAKTGVQGPTKVGSESEKQQQQSPKIGQQKQDPTKVGQQQKGIRATPQSQSSDKQQGIKGPGTPDLTPAGSPSPGATRARSQPKAVSKTLCPVCNTAELNIHAKEPPNYKTCTHCKAEVCSLCGFSPPDSDGREWLCLTCQIQRAQGSIEPPGPPTKKSSPSKISASQTQTPSPAEPIRKEMSAPGLPQNMQSKSIKVPAKGEAEKGPENLIHVSPASSKKMTPETQRKPGPQKPQLSSQTGQMQSSATSAPQQASGGIFGFGGGKKEPTKADESVTGKMFGFGSSIFSSASTLIASAVQDEPKTTPPVSPKMQPAKDTKAATVQRVEQENKQQPSQEEKAQSAGQGKLERSSVESPKAVLTSRNAPNKGRSTCPICKMGLNMDSKDPPNYSSCTECKSIVCNQCGFNPMPNVKEGKEWLCLNCQVKRAAGGSEPQKDTSSASSFKEATAVQSAPQKTSVPGFLHKDVSTPPTQPAKAEGLDSCKKVTPAAGQETSKEGQKPGPQKQTKQTVETAQKQGIATTQETGGFFGFGGSKSQAVAAKPGELMTGKMFGFGTSILSSASNLITSAVQDESKITPPVSPKMSPAKDSKSPTVKKQELEKKPQEPKQAMGPTTAAPKTDKPSSEPPNKTSASPVVSKTGESTCPLCKVQLNVGSKDTPNYNTCTECKSTVCNQCGFNPTPNVQEVKEWLCLNCQVQRALGASEPPGTPKMKLQTSPNKAASALKKEAPSQQKDISITEKSKELLPLGSPQQKPKKSAEQTAKAEVDKGSKSQKDTSSDAGQKTPQQGQKTGPQKPLDHTSQIGPEKTKPQPDSAKAAESLGGKMFGFGSSIFSTASTIITSAVQDDSKTTPPVSPKMPVAKGTKLSPVQKHEQEKKPQQIQQPKTSPLLQPKVEKGPREPLKGPVAPDVPKAGQSSCMLCKTALNFESKDPPNYNKCTECKNTVCNQCGFNPKPNVSEAKEWLCLNCQMQRALGATELTGPPMKSQSGANQTSPSAIRQKIIAPTQEENQKKELFKSETKTEAPVPVSLQKKGSPTPGSPQKTQSSAVTSETKSTKEPEGEMKSVPTVSQKTQKMADQANLLERGKPEKSPSGPKTEPDVSKTTESLSGKMFGFGSSIFSSASTLISAAVQEDSQITPPGSRKMSAPAQVSPKMSAVSKISPKCSPAVSPKISPAREKKILHQKPELEKKSDESHPSKDGNASPQPPKVSQTGTDVGQTTCPLCKVEMNIGSKQPPNYNLCTECKITVCNQCGFIPMPIGEVKEWLCLTCQMKRAIGASDLPGPPTLKSQTSPNKVPISPPVQLKDSKLTAPQRKDSLDSVEKTKETSKVVSPQKKESEADAASFKQTTDQKTPEEKLKTVQKKLPDQQSQPERKLSNATPAAQQESVSGKMLGFSSSIFSSASSMITSAVRDQLNTTPPVSPKTSPKMSPAKESKSPIVQKVEQEKKSDQPQQAEGQPSVKSKPDEIKSPASQKHDLQKPSLQTKTSPSLQAKVDKTPSGTLKPEAGPQAREKPDQSTCPLCKIKLNMGSKDPPNYNTCTQCKNTVCNQCGFNPRPNETVVKEWLCLTCQMQRALQVTETPEVASLKSQTSTKSQRMDVTSTPEPGKREPSALQSPQRKLSATAQPDISETANKPVVQKQVSPVPSQIKTQEPQKTSSPDRSPGQTRSTERKQSNATAASQKDSGGFFGLSGGKTQPEVDSSAESATGKMFGFGSSIFSTASNLITSAVQDQPKTTPPVSPKISPAREIKSPAAQEKKKPELDQTKTTDVRQAKVDKAPPEPPKTKEASQSAVKLDQFSCPLCKAKLNMRSNDPPNYNTCTQCKNTVCNQCGFNPMPNQSEMKEWLCLTCQMQRALAAAESGQPPVMKSQASPSKVSAPVSSQKDVTANQKKDVISTEKAGIIGKTLRDSPTHGAAQKKEDILQTAGVSGPTKEEKPSLPPAGDVSIFSPPQNKAREPVVPNLLKSMPAEAPPVTTDGENLVQKEASLSFEPSKVTSVKKEDKVEGIEKSADQLVKSLDKTSEIQISPKSSPQVSQRKPSLKDAEHKEVQNTQPEIIPHKPPEHTALLLKESKIDKDPQESATPEAPKDALKADGSTCPLCKLELNVDSENPPNFNTCTDCKSIVCNKCGFSPIPNVTKAKEWLCLNCQMQRALGASEPPGLPMIKPQPSPSKEVSVTTQKKETPTVSLMQGISKPVTPSNELGNIIKTKETEISAVSVPSMEVKPTAASLPDKTASSTVTKIDVSGASQKPPSEMPKGQPDAPHKQTEKGPIPSKPALPSESKAGEPLLQKSPKAITPSEMSVSSQDQKEEKPPLKQPPKTGTSPAKSVPPQVQPPKQESGSFFGFGRPKTPPTAAKSGESVTGKMFGFGSSFLSSASTLISSAVQDEPKTTPPTPRKMSTTDKVTPKSTPPASPKTVPAKDTKPPLVQKAEEKKPEKTKQDKIHSAEQSKVSKSPSELPKPPADTKDASKADQSVCPLCKIKLTMGSTDPPNYKTCTGCKTTVCVQCGFDAMPTISEVKEWLCLNCQMQRALGAPESTGLPAVKQQPSQSKASQLPSEQKEKPTQDKDIHKEDAQATLNEKETPKAKVPVSSAPDKMVTSQRDSVQKAQVVSATEQGQATTVSDQQKTAEKQQQVQVSRSTMPAVKPGFTTKEAGKLPSQPSKVTQPAKSPTPVQPPKQDSGGFFGFGGPKTQATAAKSSESVTGKMFGFGSSILSSASTLITSAVQEEPKTTPPTPRKMSTTAPVSPKATPPTPRKMSTTAPVSPKATPPVSPKITPSKDTKSPAAQKSETPQQHKPAPSAQEKAEKAPPETLKSKDEIKVASKTGPPTCPLCKVELNVGSKDSPNYNTCTECKNTVCNLCGFNPMPHTAAKEWLCLNCQTQRALSGALGDSGIMLQTPHVAPKPESQATPATNMTELNTASIKVEAPTATTKPQPVPTQTKTVEIPPTAKAESVKMETAESIPFQQREPDTTPISITAKISLPAAEKEPYTSALEPLIPEAELPNTPVLKTATVKNKEETDVTDNNETEIPKFQESKPDLLKTESDAQTCTPSPVSRSEAKSAPIVPSAAEVAVSKFVQEEEIKPEHSVSESIVTEVQPSYQIKLKEQTNSLQQSKGQEQQPAIEAEPIMATETEKVVKTEDKIMDIISTQESQPISTVNKTKDKDESDEKLMYKRKMSPSNEQVQMENIAVPGTKIKSNLRTEESDEDQPQILPVVQEVSGWQSSDASKNDTNIDPTLPVEEKVKSERRRLSVQAMDESSESELTPSSSPHVQKKILKVSTVSSSSDEIKTESADSSIEEDDFIRKQIMGMGDEKEMSVSEDENENIANAEYMENTRLDNASTTDKSLSQKAETEIKDTTTLQNVPETISKTTFKKAIPVMRQRQSTDEEVESITESLSKGSSSVQASSITPGSSPTSVSSLEEDSDSSPRHRKVGLDKQHRKVRPKQPPQSLFTLENSSEEEKMKTHNEPMSSSENASSTEDLKQVTVIDESHKTSDSEYSVSIESDPEIRRAVQRGRKPSATVIPYTPSDQFKEQDTITKSLKSAEEAYEEIIQKTKAIPGESPPDIEPLYGGMAIEDYLYESLVEEPEFKLSESQEEEPQIDSSSESLKKLRSPEEVYEEMMKKKRELMMIEQEFQQAQTAMESSSSGALVHTPPSEAETCVVTISTDETNIIGQSDTTPPRMDTLSELPVKKKKRPAPPRPSEPPKRTVGTVVPTTPSGSISFVRPMVPQDPSLRKALFPIPDLKITQCSSGEEEDDSLADEYAIGISSDITTSDDSDTKDDPSISPPLSETTEMEPICVVCEMPEPKPIPTPISAPELTTTPSTVSPVSPPTSPASPDSSLASNATSSSSFQPQTPLSSDSTPLSTPTPPMSFKDQLLSDFSVQLPDTVTTVQVGETLIPCPASTTVVVTIPDLVSDPFKSQATEELKYKSSTAEASNQPLVETSTAVSVKVQMPDLVSSPSQVPNKVTGVLQVSAPSPAPVLVSSQRTVQVTATPVTGTTPVPATDVSSSVSLVSCPEPVIIQMPDLVSTTAPIVAQTPKPISALITTPAQAQAKVVHSIPVHSAVPLMRPVVVSAQAQAEQGPPLSSASTTVIKKKVPPPPPPRSTSVSLPEISKEMPVAKTVDVVSATSSIKTTMAAQQMQSVVVDIQTRMEVNQFDSVSVPQVVTPARQGHVVIIVPSVENISPLGLGQTTQNEDNTGSEVPAQAYSTKHPVSDITKTGISSLSPRVSAVQVLPGPPFPPKPPVAAKGVPSIIDADPFISASSTLPKPAVYPKSSVPIQVTNATAAVSPVSVTMSDIYQASKPPPPIPPKPVSIPAGLVFSHKPGEHVKPPPPPVAPKAATLPRMKEPPKVLSLSLTRPVESKLGATSPKSPLSPRHTKCLQTYVVITLPSEPGSPTETITVQAPMRGGSIPSSKVSMVQTTQAEQKTPSEAFSVQATVRRASVPSVKQPPPITVASSVAVEYVSTSEVVLAKAQARRDSFPSAVKPPLSVADVITVSSDQGTPIQAHTVAPPIKKLYMVQQQSMPQPPPDKMSEVIALPTEHKVYIQPYTDPIIAKEQSTLFVPEQPIIIPEAETIPSAILPEDTFPQAPKPISPVQKESLTETEAVPLQPELLLDEVVIQGRPTSVCSPVRQQEVSSQIEVVQEEQTKPTHVFLTDTVPIKSSVPNLQILSDHPVATPIVQDTEIMPAVKEEMSSQQANLVAERVTQPTKVDYSTELFTIDTGVRIPEVAVVSPVPHALTVVAEITPTPQMSQALPIPTVGVMATHATAETTPSLFVLEDQQKATYPDVTYLPQEYGINTSSVMSHPLPSLEIRALQHGHETPTEIITKDTNERTHSIFSSELQHQTIPVITSEETSCRRRTSLSSTEQPPYTTSNLFTYPAEYEMSPQLVATDVFAAPRRESITMKEPLPFAQILKMPAEKDVPTNDYAAQVSYKTEYIPSTEQQLQVSPYSSEYDYPVEILTTEEYTRRTSVPSTQDITQGISVAPVTITKIQQESIESQEFRGTEKVVSSMSHMYSSSISTSGQPPESLSSLVTQVVTTEVQRTTVSVVHERLPQVHPQSVTITIQPDIAKVQPLPKQNGKIIYPGDVIDLRTIKSGIKMTEQGMDLTPPESCRQSFSSDSIGRQSTAVQPEIVNLSAEITPTTTLSVVTDNITIVTCTATIASYSNTPAEKPLDLQGPVASLPVPLTTYKPFEPLAQIVYRPVKGQPVFNTVASTAQNLPINLSYEGLVSSGGKQPMTSAQTVISNGVPVLSLEATGAMDLSNYRPVRAMVALSGTSPGVVTSIVEDDGIPMDLTAGRRSICCDVIYKLPFTGSCRTQPTITTQPDNRFGYRDDHYQYNNAGLYSIKRTNGIKASVSDTNLTEAGLSLYDLKNDYDYLSGSSDGAIDLTAAKLSAGEALDYTSKATRVYPAITAPYSQVPAAGFGVNSALRTSDGIVYSSVAAPVPSTYAITTQPGSIFSTTLTPTSKAQDQSLLPYYGFIPTTDPGQLVPFEAELSKELLPPALADIITGYPEMYSDTTLEAIAASLDALASSPIFPGLDNTKMAQYQMEREFLELEKLKQLCLAEELEWERQEIQRYREQEQLMVQRELEELQALKQQLLLQQEEEHHAHMVAQQETYAQQKEQLQQIQQLQLQLQRQLDEHYGSTGSTGNLLEAKYAGVGDSGQYWPVKDESTPPSTGVHTEDSHGHINLVKLQADQDIGKKILDSGVQTDDEDSAEKQHMGRKKKIKKNIESSAQSDDEDQDEWDAPTKVRRRSRKHSSEGKHGSKVSSIAIQTVAEISVQTDHSGTIKRPNVQMDTKVEIIKHISAPEISHRGGSLSCQTDSDRKPIEVGYSTQLTADIPSKSKVLYTSVSPLSPEKSYGGQRMLTADPTRFSSGPRILKSGQKSLSDHKSLSPSTEEKMGGYYADSYSGRGSPSGTGKKVKRTLPDPPPEDDSLTGRSGYSTNSARRRLARSTTLARAKILQDIDKELDLVERESSKLRKKQAELDEEEKEIDAKLRLWAKRLP
ncbi:protein piccolo isoform X7 [Kryptolebias marmoratus]|uniref:protein piccolo isoform X7 n=1 Tax=Kryptolebias marmoratus TaxID=37003 RepID=UPI0007F9188D|nr:protein piccolo isoform X7 [Kryptolebias marmoratus]